MKTSNKIIEWNKAFEKIVRSGSKPTQAKIKYQQSLVNDDLTIRELKANTYLMFKAIGSDQVAKDSEVWIKESNSYCREDKKYIVTNCADHNKTKYVDGSKKIFTSFTY